MIDMNFIDMTLPEMKEQISRLGEKSFRAKQIYEWINVKNASSWEEMTNLPKNLRVKLEAEEPLNTPRERDRQISAVDGTRKYLFEMHDGQFVESVLMKYKHGNTVCISSQLGCRMGCAFCASTIGGLTWNLTAGEMLGQI